MNKRHTKNYAKFLKSTGRYPSKKSEQLFYLSIVLQILFAIIIYLIIFGIFMLATMGLGKFVITFITLLFQIEYGQLTPNNYFIVGVGLEAVVFFLWWLKRR